MIKPDAEDKAAMLFWVETAALVLMPDPSETDVQNRMAAHRVTPLSERELRKLVWRQLREERAAIMARAAADRWEQLRMETK